mgnify:CR=1 FL=1
MLDTDIILLSSCENSVIRALIFFETQHPRKRSPLFPQRLKKHCLADITKNNKSRTYFALGADSRSELYNRNLKKKIQTFFRSYFSILQAAFHNEFQRNKE